MVAKLFSNYSLLDFQHNNEASNLILIKHLHLLIGFEKECDAEQANVFILIDSISLFYVNFEIFIHIVTRT